jgi:hypothetical protein
MSKKTLLEEGSVRSGRRISSEFHETGKFEAISRRVRQRNVQG